MCYQLSSTKVDAQSVINWTVVDQLSPNSTIDEPDQTVANPGLRQVRVHVRPSPVHVCVVEFVTEVDSTSELRQSTSISHSDRQALSTARFRRADLLATADTCRP